MGTKKITRETIDLGTFQVISGVLRISDPCYDKDVWCAGAVSNVLNGTWKAQVVKRDNHDNWGNRCRKLVAVHESFDPDKVTIDALPFEVGVDSGCAGIFDDSMYKVDFASDQPMLGRQAYDQKQYDYHFNERVKLFQRIHKSLEKTGADLSKYPYLLYYQDMKEEPTKATLEYSKDWREVASDVTFSNIGAGVIRNGVCSRSGDGDGGYTAYAAYDQNGRVVGVKILF